MRREKEAPPFIPIPHPLDPPARSKRLNTLRLRRTVPVRPGALGPSMRRFGSVLLRCIRVLRAQGPHGHGAELGKKKCACSEDWGCLALRDPGIFRTPSRRLEGSTGAAQSGGSPAGLSAILRARPLVKIPWEGSLGTSIYHEPPYPSGSPYLRTTPHTQT